MNDLIADIEAARLSPVYYLCGERYPVDRVSAALRRAVLGGKNASAFNFDALGPDAGAREILSAVRTVPMLGRARLVQVRDAHLLSAEELNKLLPYLEDPAPFSHLLFTAEKADLRLKFFSRLKKLGVVQRFDPLKHDTGRLPILRLVQATRLGVQIGQRLLVAGLLQLAGCIQIVLIEGDKRAQKLDSPRPPLGKECAQRLRVQGGQLLGLGFLSWHFDFLGTLGWPGCGGNWRGQATASRMASTSTV